MFLTVGVSFLAQDIDRAIILIKNQLKSIETFIPFSLHVMYCIQAESYHIFLRINSEIQSCFPRVALLYGGVKGVAKSRNILIANCITDYLWFWDIDCSLSNPVYNLAPLLQRSSTTVVYIKTPYALVVRSRSLLRAPIIDLLAKRLRIIEKVRFAFNAATYNILINVNYFRLNHIRFDERLGLGTFFHQSDEAMFILEFLIKNRGFLSSEAFKVYSLDQPFGISMSHAVSGELLNNSIQSKGYVASCLVGPVLAMACLPFLALIFSSKHPAELSYFHCLRLLLAGLQMSRD